MRIQHNIMAMNAYRNYNTNTSALSKNLEKLSSGYKINRAGDDAAGLAISEKMRAQITGLNAAQKNVKDGISLVKTAEGAMQEIQDMLNRMDYLATQSANGTYDNEVDRYNLQKEVNQLRSEINRIADSANFNGINLLDGKNGLQDGVFTASTVTAPTTEMAFDDVTSTLGDANFTTTQVASASSHEIHFTEAGVTQQATAGFTVDFDTFKLDLTAVTAGSATTVTVNFGGQDVAVTITHTAGTNDTITAGDFASAFATAFNSVTGGVGGTSKTGGFLTGMDMAFKATASGSKVTFEFDGMKTGTTYATTGASTKYSTTAATSFNNFFKGANADVKITPSTDANVKILDGNYNHGVKDIVEAKAETPDKRAGIDFDLSTNVVKDGNVLEIDGKKFFFKTSATSNITQPTDAELIDVSDSTKYATAADQAKQAAILISKTANGTTNFDITTDNAGKLHIDQKSSSTNKYTSFNGAEDTTKKEYNLKNVFKLSEYKSVAGDDRTDTTLTINTDSLKDGNKLKLGDTTYVFTSNPDSAASGEVVVDFNDPLNDLVSKINDIKDSSNAQKYEATLSGSTITIKSKNGDDTTLSARGIGQGLTLQIGDTSKSYNQLSLTIGDMHVDAMGTMDENDNMSVVSGKSIEDIDISTQAGAQQAVDVIKNAINYVSGVRGDLGATQNRLEHTANNLSVMAENIQDAESTIRDTDIAEEMMAYTKNNILVQSAQAMLAQANAVPQGVLQLLG